MFGQPDRLKALNRIIHSHIQHVFIKHLLVAFFWRFSRVVVLDAPLLFETNMQYICRWGAGL